MLFKSIYNYNLKLWINVKNNFVKEEILIIKEWIKKLWKVKIF